MKAFLIGIVVAFIGFVISSFLTGIFKPSAEFSYYYMTVWGIFYLSGVIATCTVLILKKLNNKQNGDD